MRSPHARSGSSIRRVPTHFAAIALLALPTSLDAAEPGARAETWDLQPDELQTRGLGQSRGDPRPVPPGDPRLVFPVEPKFAKQGRIFVNFDGAQLSSGFDDAQANVTQIDECAGSFAAYGDGVKRDAVMQAVRDDWAAYNVIITDVRPDSGDYTMNMTGPSNPFGGGVLGIAPLDCEDEQTHNNITYAFHSANDQFDASTQATTIGQEVAHSYGLEHVDEPGDIMNPFNAGGDPSFTDVCIGIVANGGIVCGNQHTAECGSSSLQNSHAELMTLFGPSTPDSQSPTVSITAPADGAEYDEGATFEITVDAADDVAIDQVALFNNGTEIETDASTPYGWTVQNAPAGSYEFYVEATDTAGNVSMSNTVTVSVGGVAPTDEGGTADEGGNAEEGVEGGEADDGDADDGDADGGDGDGGDGDSGSFDDSGDGSLPPGFGVGREQQSCACSHGTTPQGAAWLLLAIAPLVRRRVRPSV